MFQNSKGNLFHKHVSILKFIMFTRKLSPYSVRVCWVQYSLGLKYLQSQNPGLSSKILYHLDANCSVQLTHETVLQCQQLISCFNYKSFVHLKGLRVLPTHVVSLDRNKSTIIKYTFGWSNQLLPKFKGNRVLSQVLKYLRRILIFDYSGYS